MAADKQFLFYYISLVTHKFIISYNISGISPLQSVFSCSFQSFIQGSAIMFSVTISLLILLPKLILGSEIHILEPNPIAATLRSLFFTEEPDQSLSIGFFNVTSSVSKDVVNEIGASNNRSNRFLVDYSPMKLYLFDSVHVKSFDFILIFIQDTHSVRNINLVLDLCIN